MINRHIHKQGQQNFEDNRHVEPKIDLVVTVQPKIDLEDTQLTHRIEHCTIPENA